MYSNAFYVSLRVCSNFDYHAALTGSNKRNIFSRVGLSYVSVFVM